MTTSYSEPYISILVPSYNEGQSLPLLIDDIISVMKMHNYSYEMIIINDGSTDNSRDFLDNLTVNHRFIKVIHLRRNSGQTSAIMAGIDNARGEIIIPLDADLQNDPHDIPLLIDELNKGYDVCSGWRKCRKDNALSRTIPSKIANFIIKKISGVKLHDYGCTLKAYRNETLKGIRLYGEMHRFIPIYTAWNGAKITEVPVNHHPRKYGKSKYGLKRTVKVILDLMVVQFTQTYFQRPIYVFGGFGLLNFLLSFLTFSAMVYLKYWGNKTFIQTPLPLIAVLFLLVGIISIFMGFLAQIVMMTYFESQDRKPYMIAYTRNLE